MCIDKATSGIAALLYSVTCLEMYLHVLSCCHRSAHIEIHNTLLRNEGNKYHQITLR